MLRPDVYKRQAMTFLSSYLLSATVLRGVSSSFTLEMPPYRRPQIGKVILRSVTDRTLFVLGRAAAVAAPAGLILWLLANVSPGGISLLSRISLILDPLGRLLGMDGVIPVSYTQLDVYKRQVLVSADSGCVGAEAFVS